jgi:hypothetical protein
LGIRDGFDYFFQEFIHSQSGFSRNFKNIFFFATENMDDFFFYLRRIRIGKIYLMRRSSWIPTRLAAATAINCKPASTRASS